MGRPTKAQSLLRAARDGQPVARVAVPRVACPRCGQTGIYALPNGVTPRPHLRPARPGDPGYSEMLPARVDCEQKGMTLGELHALVPDELKVTPELVPDDIREGMTYVMARDAMRDAGTAEDQIPSLAEWRASHAVTPDGR